MHGRDGTEVMAGGLAFHGRFERLVQVDPPSLAVVRYLETPSVGIKHIV